MHSTNRAFERYLIADPESMRDAYARARNSDQVLIKFPEKKKAAK